MSVTAAEPRRFAPSRWIPATEEWIASFHDSRKARIWIAVFYVIVAAAVVVPVVLGPGKALSRIDEPTHADYAFQAAHFTLPHAGSPIAPEIRAHWACVGQEGYELPVCGSDLGAWAYPYDGQNYNFAHPPLYYVVVGFPARVLDAVVPGIDFVTAARLTGIGWLAGGMFMLYRALRRWRLDPAAALIAPLLLPVFPRVLHASTTVNPDAAAVLFGAAAVWLAAKIFVEDYAGWVLPAVLTALAGLTKTITAVPFIAIALLIVFRLVRDLRIRRFHKADLAIPLGIVAAVLVPYGIWQLFQGGRGDPYWTNPLVGLNTRDVTGLPGSEWLETAFSGINLASEYYLQPPLDVALMVAWTRLLNVIVIGAVFAVIVACAKEPARRSLGWMVLAGVFIYPTIVQVQAYLNTAVPQYFPSVTGRYGLALIPGAIACICVAAWKAGYRRIVYFFVIGGLTVLTVVISNGFMQL